jgi:HK97 gp10 family phage protein
MADIRIVKDNIDEYLKAVGAAKQRGLEKVGLTAERYAKALCPVDTGRLRNSISHAVEGDSAYIGTNVEYAPYVEMGTVRTRAQPYLKPAAQDHADEYKKLLLDELHNA